MTDKIRCAGKIKSRGGWERNLCHRHGLLEHDGLMWCRLHHPPTVEAKYKQRTENRVAGWNEHYRLRAEATKKRLLGEKALEVQPKLLAVLMSGLDTITAIGIGVQCGSEFDVEQWKATVYAMSAAMALCATEEESDV